MVTSTRVIAIPQILNSDAPTREKHAATFEELSCVIALNELIFEAVGRGGFKWTSLQINRNSYALPHTDSNNVASRTDSSRVGSRTYPSKRGLKRGHPQAGLERELQQRRLDHGVQHDPHARPHVLWRWL